MGIAIVIIIAIIVLISLLLLKQKLKRKIKCRVCYGSGKIWEEVHDSADLQITNCQYCNGSGEIKQKTKKKETKEMPIMLTQDALKKIKELMEMSNPIMGLVNTRMDPATTFLRLGVRGGGCSGLSYLLEFDGETTDKDKIFEFFFPGAADTEPKLKVVVDKKSYIYLNGTTLDHATVGLESGFKFNNPNVKSESGCGCGQSFSA